MRLSFKSDDPIDAEGGASDNLLVKNLRFLSRML